MCGRRSVSRDLARFPETRPIRDGPLGCISADFVGCGSAYSSRHFLRYISHVAFGGSILFERSSKSPLSKSDSHI